MLVKRHIATEAEVRQGLSLTMKEAPIKCRLIPHRPRQASRAVMRDTLDGTMAIMLIDRTHQHQLYLVEILNRTRNSKLIKCSLIQPQASGADMRDTFVGTMSKTSIERIHHRHRNDNSRNGEIIRLGVQSTTGQALSL